jgi:transposase-like protein
MAKKKQAKPYYGEKTKKKIIEEYFRSSATMRELAELHGILGSNTIGDWVKKYGNLKPKNSPIMRKDTHDQDAKNNRQKRQRNYEQHQISRLECDLDRAKKRVQFYSIALNLINDLAIEAHGTDLLKKTGDELSRRQISQKS